MVGRASYFEPMGIPGAYVCWEYSNPKNSQALSPSSFCQERLCRFEGSHAQIECVRFFIKRAKHCKCCFTQLGLPRVSNFFWDCLVVNLSVPSRHNTAHASTSHVLTHNAYLSCLYYSISSLIGELRGRRGRRVVLKWT